MQTDKTVKTSKDDARFEDKRNEEMSRLNTEIENFRDETAKVIDDLYDQTARVKYLIYRFILYSVVFAVVAFIFYGSSAWTLIPISTTLFKDSRLIQLFIFSVLIVLVAYAIYRAFENALFSIRKGSEIKSEQVKNKEGTALDSAREETNKRFDTLVANIRKFIPILDHIYQNEEKERLLDTFRTTMYNALKRYGFRDLQPIGKYLINFIDPFDLEAKWVDKASIDVAQSLKTNAELIKLAYYDFKPNIEYFRNSWIKVVNDESIFRMLIEQLTSSKILGTKFGSGLLRETEYARKRLLKDHPDGLTLEKLVSYFNKTFGELWALKDTVSRMIIDYHFRNTNTIIEQVSLYSPSENDKNWRDDALNYISKIANISIPVLSLFLSGYNSIGWIESPWPSIREHKDQLEELTKHLIENKLLSLPEQYYNNTNQLESLIGLVSSIIGKTIEYSLRDERERVLRELTRLADIKQLFIQSLGRVGLALSKSDTKEFLEWIPIEITDREVGSHLAELLGINFLYCLHFYYTFLGESKKSLLILTKISEKKLIPDFADFLVSRNNVKLYNEKNKEEEVSNLSYLIEKRGAVDQDISYQHYRLNEIYQEYKRIAVFLSEQFELTSNKPNFNEVVDMFIGDNVTEKEQIIQRLMNTLMHQINSEGEFKMSQESIEIAAIALYEVNYKGSERHWACQQAYYDDDARNLLYLYVKSFDDLDRGNIENPQTLGAILKVYDPSQIKDNDQVQRFSNELKKDEIPSRISKLYRDDLRSIDHTLRTSGLEKQLDETLNELQGSNSFMDFMDLKLPYNLFVESLNMQLVSAYMITTKGKRNERIIGEVVDRYLPRALKDVMSQEGLEGHADLLLTPTEKSEKTILGKNVRVGLVPFNMTFERFAELYRKAYEGAVDRYLSVQKEGFENSGTYFANLIRIFPSNRFFKPLGRNIVESTEEKSDDPIYAVRTIMAERFKRSQTLEIVAALGNRGDKSIALSQMLVFVLDTYGSIYKFIERDLERNEELHESISATMLNWLRKKGIDNELISSYKKSGISDLCVYVYEELSKKELNSGAINFKNNFHETFINLIHKFKNLNEIVKDNLANVVLNRLFDLGKLLIGIRVVQSPSK